MTECGYCECNGVVICDKRYNVVLNCSELLLYHPKTLMVQQIEDYDVKTNHLCSTNRG